MDWFTLIRCIINILSVTVHIVLLLLIQCKPSLSSPVFDEIFFSSNIADIVAVILRVVTTYMPVIILRNHSGIVAIDKNTFVSVVCIQLVYQSPLATVTNATQWYISYLIIISTIVFAADRAVMAVSFHSYSWFCNRFFKWILVFLSWFVPFVWVLPMFDECCRSSYIDDRVDLLEMTNPIADSTYDSIDMIFETLFYVPVICTLNTFTLVMIYHKWRTLMTKIEKKEMEMKNGKLATILEISILCIEKNIVHIEKSIPEEKEDEKTEYRNKLRERLELELSFAMISNIEQVLEFFVILFYSLYWASYMDFIDWNYKMPMEIYYVLFEIGTLISPYLLFLFCKNLRQEFAGFFRQMFSCRKHVH